MEIKKYKKADIEKHKSVFLKIGFVIAIGLMLLAFEWSTPAEMVSDLGTIRETEVEQEIIPITLMEKIKKPQPQKNIKIAEILNIVQDDEKIDEEMAIIDMEATDDTEILEVELPDEEEDKTIFEIVQQKPEFPGGDLALQKWIARNIKYPSIARLNDIQGKVFVRFCVTKSGMVEQVSIARGVDTLLDNEAIRVVKLLPRWEPGKQRDKPVNVWYHVPINFQLN